MKNNQDNLKIYIAPHPLSIGLSLASRKRIFDGIKFSSELGFKKVLLGKRANIPINPIFYYLKMIGWWKKADIILTIYPNICIPIIKDNYFRAWDSKLIKRLNKSKFSMLYVKDLPIEQRNAFGNNKDKKAFESEKRILKSFDILLVFNKKMKDNIKTNYDIEDEKFIEFEILDYGIDFTPNFKKEINESFKIAFPGAISKNQSQWIKNLPDSKNIIFEFYGKNGQWISKLNQNNIKYKGVFSPDKLPKYISENSHFGLINYKSKVYKYLEYGSTSKFSAFMVAALPVLCPSKITYLSELIDKYQVGLTFDSLEEIPALINSLTNSKYEILRNNCIKLGEKIKDGFFFKNAVNNALNKKEQ